MFGNSNRSMFAIALVFSLGLVLQDDGAHAQAVEKKVIVTVNDEGRGGAWLGVQLKELDEKMREELDTKARYGAVIDDVVDDSPADKAGLEPSDVVVKFDKKAIRRPRDLTFALRKYKEGDQVEVEIMRGQERKTIKVILGKRNERQLLLKDKFAPEVFVYRSEKPDVYLGIEVQKLNDDLAEYFKVNADSGLLITDVEAEGPADKAGLKSGDILVGVDGEKPGNAEEIGEILGEHEKGSEIEVDYVRKGQLAQTKVTLESRPGPHHFDFNFPTPSPDVGWWSRDGKELRRQITEEQKRALEEVKEYQLQMKDEIRERVKREIERSQAEKDRGLERLRMELDRLREELDQLKAKMQ